MNSSSSQNPTPFLTLTTTEINGWAMALCPEFEVSACGSDRDVVRADLFDMIKRNAFLLLKDKEKIQPHLAKWAEEVVQQEDISVLFKK